MNAETFLENFGHLAEAPGGVKKLREMILQLAVRGKLVEAQGNHTPPPITTRRYENNDVASPRRRKTKPLPPVERNEVGFDPPCHWQVARLGACCELVNGRAYKRHELLNAGTPVIRIQNLNGGDSWYYSDLSLPHEKYCHDGDLLFAWSASFGPYIWRGPRAIFHYHIWRMCLSDVLDKRFTYHLLQYLTAEVKARSHGLAMLHMTKSKMEEWPIPLPPLAEQRRIVAKVDELMALCDELEARQQERNGVRVRLNEAALDRLTTAGDDDELTAAWTRVRSHFDTLYTVPENVAALRQAILQLAVRGKLVEQDPNDEPAEELLRRIQSLVIELKKTGSIRNRKPLPPLTAGEVPSLAPNQWVWTRFDEISEIVSGVTKGRRLNGKATAEFPYLRVANVQAGYLDLTELKRIEIPVEELGKYRLLAGDLLLTEGGDWDKLGRSAIWDGEIGDCIHQNHVFRARVIDPGVRPQWLRLFTNSPIGRRYFQSAAKRTTNLASINMTQLRHCPIPLPPTAEQDRILQKVETLLSMCDDLEARLAQQQGDADRLTEALVAEMLEGAASGVGA